MRLEQSDVWIRHCSVRETENERDVANRNDAVAGGVRRCGESERERERDGEEAFRWNGDGTRPFPRSERDIERGAFARICRRCSLAPLAREEETDKDRSGQSSLEKTQAAFSSTWRKEGGRKMRGSEARSRMQMRAVRAECEVREVGKEYLFSLGRISLERTRKHAVKISRRHAETVESRDA